MIKFVKKKWEDEGKGWYCHMFKSHVHCHMFSQQGYSYVPKNIYILFRKISVSLKINLRHSIEVKLGIQENQIWNRLKKK